MRRSGTCRDGGWSCPARRRRRGRGSRLGLGRRLWLWRCDGGRRFRCCRLGGHGWRRLLCRLGLGLLGGFFRRRRLGLLGGFLHGFLCRLLRLFRRLLGSFLRGFLRGFLGGLFLRRHKFFLALFILFALFSLSHCGPPVAADPCPSSVQVVRFRAGPIDQFNPGRKPPVAQSRSSIV